MRHRDPHDCCVSGDTMDLLECRDYVVEVLDDIVGQHFAELSIAKGPRPAVQIEEHIGADLLGAIDIHSTLDPLSTTPEVQDASRSFSHHRTSSALVRTVSPLGRHAENESITWAPSGGEARRNHDTIDDADDGHAGRHYN